MQQHLKCKIHPVFVYQDSEINCISFSLVVLLTGENVAVFWNHAELQHMKDILLCANMQHLHLQSDTLFSPAWMKHGKQKPC